MPLFDDLETDKINLEAQAEYLVLKPRGSVNESLPSGMKIDASKLSRFGTVHMPELGELRAASS